MAEHFSLTQERRFLSACRVLFGSEVEAGRDFLNYLQLEGVRAAYHNRAKLTHPDRFPGADLDFLRLQAEKFQRVVGAYDVLHDFLKARERGIGFARRPAAGPPRPPRRPETPLRHASSRVRPAPTLVRPAALLPRRRLPFGLFLCHHGIISYGDLARALVWQRQQRPRLGDLARLWGRLSEPQVQVILGDEGRRRFGEKAIALGLLNQFQVDTMIHYQRSRQQPLGTFFVDEGLIAPRHLSQLLVALHEHNENMMIELPWLRRFFGIFF